MDSPLHPERCAGDGPPPGHGWCLAVARAGGALGAAKNLRSSPEDLGYVLRKKPFRKLTQDDGDGDGSALEGILDRWFFSGESEPANPLLYDAVIALGLAACDASTSFNSSGAGDYFDGPAHFEAFARTAFDGASGRVAIDPVTGTRVATSAHFSLTNFVEEEATTTNGEGGNPSVQFKSVPSASFENGTWVEVTPYVYADGSHTPPPDLPPVAVDENRGERPGWSSARWRCCWPWVWADGPDGITNRERSGLRNPSSWTSSALVSLSLLPPSFR